MSFSPVLMPFPRLPWLFFGILALGLLGCGGSEPEKTEPKTSETKSESPPPKKTDTKPSEPKPVPQESPGPKIEQQVTDDPESQLKADLDDAVSLLEKGDMQTFIDRYLPVEILLKIRAQTEPLQGSYTDEQFQKKWLDKLRAMQKSPVTFLDDGKTLARLDVETSDENVIPPALRVSNPAEAEPPPTEGFTGDLQEVIKKSIAALEAKEYESFIKNLFPASELTLATSGEGMQGLLLRLNEHPQMVEQMLADLKAIQKLSPEMDEQQTTATFQLNAGTNQARTVRFEKQETWRFANTAKQVRSQVYQQARQSLDVMKSHYKTEWI
ncbi:MAG: hypothetical protein KDA84_21285, partial [Planctomycetaceae bacterium]|nr:hypothetical protein [Planctomycetaceae bacterium]